MYSKHMVNGDRFISGCRYVGGQIRDDGKKIVCAIGPDLRVEMDKKYRDIKILDHRAKPGRNLIDINDIDNIEVDDRRLNALIMYSGDSNVSIGRDAKIVTTLQPEFAYPEIHEGGRVPVMMHEPELRIKTSPGEQVIDYRRPGRIEACPVGSTQDDRTGVCIPHPEMKRQLESRPVLAAQYSAVRWRESDDEMVLVSDDNAMAKASLGTWLNSALPLAKAFKQARKPLTIEIVVGDELKGRTPKTGPNYDVRIGRGTYDRRKLYEIAEEAIGEQILDHDRGLPVKKALGKRLPFKVLQSDEPDSPIVIKGEGDVFYFLAPIAEG